MNTRVFPIFLAKNAEEEKRIIPTVKNSLEKGEAEILRVVKRRQLPEQKMLREKRPKKGTEEMLN